MSQANSKRQSNDSKCIDVERIDVERIDTRVKPYGRWYMAVNSLFILLIILMTVLVGIAMALTWWLIAIIVLVAALMLLVVYSQPRVLIYLTSPRLYHVDEQGGDNSHGKWQLLWQTATQQALWEARLLHCHRYGRCIQMSFVVTHPMPRNITHIIWQDQVSHDAWRRLCAFSRW